MKNNNIWLLFVLLVTLAGCSSSPKQDDEQRLEAVARQAEFYEAEAEGWRQAGNEGMAKHFEQKARHTRSGGDDDYTLFDLVFDILFE